MNKTLSDIELKSRNLHIEFNTKKGQVFIAFSYGDISLPEAQAQYQVHLQNFTLALEALNQVVSIGDVPDDGTPPAFKLLVGDPQGSAV